MIYQPEIGLIFEGNDTQVLIEERLAKDLTDRVYVYVKDLNNEKNIENNEKNSQNSVENSIQNSEKYSEI